MQLETLSRAVAYAHENGIFHRDLKPSNILLWAERTLKIADFGIARRLANHSGLTLSGAILGMPSYLKPEQARDGRIEHGPAAEIYSLGAILYKSATGRPSFRAEIAAETIQQVVSQDPVAPSRFIARVSRDLETISLKCLQKEPSNAISRQMIQRETSADIFAANPSRPDRRIGWASRVDRSAATVPSPRQLR